MSTNEINVKEFLKERECEILKLEEDIHKTKKKTMLFQRLPYYSRRRNRSACINKKKKKTTRRRDRHVLRSHIWYAKRFKMLKVNGCGLPLKRNVKSSKFIYKSFNRGFIFDESYKKAKVYYFQSNDVFCTVNGFLEKINIEIKNAFQTVDYGSEKIECAVFENYLIVCYLDFIQIDSLLTAFQFVCQLECVISTMFTNNNEKFINFIKEYQIEPSEVLQGIINHSFLRNCTETVAETGIGSVIEEINNNQSNKDSKLDVEKTHNVFYVPSFSKFETGKLFAPRKELMNNFNKFVFLGIIPISIEEIFRIGLEKNIMYYPFDFPNSLYYNDFEQSYNKPIIEKYENTPPSKRQKMNIEDLFLFTNLKIKFFIFELKKGCVKRGGFVVYDGCRIGRVIRGDYCYTTGYCKGLLFINFEKCVSNTVMLLNHNSDISYNATITEVQ